jgi:hypothetical protein
MRLIFLGAAGEVTGSCYLVDTGEVKLLIECGMSRAAAAPGGARIYGSDIRRRNPRRSTLPLTQVNPDRPGAAKVRP